MPFCAGWGDAEAKMPELPVIPGNCVKIPMHSGGKRQDSAQTGRFSERFSESRARVLVPKKGWCYTVPEDSPEGCPGKRGMDDVKETCRWPCAHGK